MYLSPLNSQDEERHNILSSFCHRELELVRVRFSLSDLEDFQNRW